MSGNAPPTRGPDYASHFAAVAPRYDALREEATDEVVGWIGEALRLAGGEALLDVGCGTGATTAALARRFDLDAVGLDRSPEMLAAAVAQRCDRCRIVEGEAERLPFADGAFDRVLMQTMVHLVRRPAAFAQARRVLRRGGALTVLTVDPAGAEHFWLANWFPSYPSIEHARFPTAATLSDELRAAAFEAVDVARRDRVLRFTRGRALAMLRARFASSFAVMDDAEFHAGLARAEREMPDAFTSTLRLLFLTAS